MDLFKTSLGRTLVVVAIVFVSLLSLKALVETLNAYRDNNEQWKNTIVVSAEGKVYANPDIAMMNFSVVSRGASVATITTENTRKMNAIVAGMKALGIDEKDIKSTSVYLNPEYDYSDDAIPNKIIGYSLSQELEVKVRQTGKTGDVLQKAITEGANQVGQVYFTIDEPEQLKSQARELAFTKAKEKAATLARQAGVSLGKIINFSDENAYYPPYMANSYEMKAQDMGMGGMSRSGEVLSSVAPVPATTPVLQPGSQAVTANVTMTYEIY